MYIEQYYSYYSIYELCHEKINVLHMQNKDAEELHGNRKLISAFVFATWIVQSLYFLNPKFQASSHPQWLYSFVCVRPGQNPRCWTSHDAAHIFLSFPITGSSFNEGIEATFKDRQMEDLWIPFFAITTDLTSSQMRVHTHGRISVSQCHGDVY